MTNDLKQIETLKITNELMIISEFAAFTISIFVGLINSWLLTIIFVIATVIPGFIQKIFIKDILSGKNKTLNILKLPLTPLTDQKLLCYMTHRFPLFLM